jgi:hypothetical protein
MSNKNLFLTVLEVGNMRSRCFQAQYQVRAGVTSKMTSWTLHPAEGMNTVSTNAKKDAKAEEGTGYFPAALSKACCCT